MPGRRSHRQTNAVHLVVSLSPAGVVTAYDTQELVRVRVPAATATHANPPALARAWARTDKFAVWEGPASLLPRVFALAREHDDPISQAMLPGFVKIAPPRRRLLEQPLRERAAERDQSPKAVERSEVLAAAYTVSLDAPDRHLPRLRDAWLTRQRRGAGRLRKTAQLLLGGSFLPSSPTHPFHTLLSSRVVEDLSTDLLGSDWRTHPAVVVESLDAEEEQLAEPHGDIEDYLTQAEQRETIERAYKNAGLSANERETYERRTLGDSATAIARDRGVRTSAIRTEYWRAKRKIARAQEKRCKRSE